MKTILLILLALYISTSSAQIPEIQWQQCYGSSELDYTRGIEQTENGYLVGIRLYTYVPGITNYHGGGEIWIVNIDTLGNIIWERCYGGSDGDVPQKIIKRNEDEFYIYGYTYSTDGDVQSGNNGHNDLWVVKINEQGEIIWEKTYGCTGIDDPRDMILTPDSGFVMIDRIGVGGGDVSNFYGSGDVWMCKCDSVGNIEWEKTLGNFGLDNCVSMIINSVGNIMMIGATQKHGGLVECYPDETWGDVWLVELDLQGNIVSQHCYGGSDYDVGINIIELEDGYIFTGGTSSNDGDVSGLHGPSGGPPNGWDDIWVVRLNEQFEILWQKCLGGYSSDSPNYLTQTEFGGLIVIGYTSSHDGDVSGNHSWQGDYYDDIWVVKLTPDGEIEWEHCYGGENDEDLYIHSVFKKEDYNYVIAAQARMNSYDVQCDLQGNKDAWVFEIDIEDTTGISNTPAMQDNVKVYPNPAEDYVVFEVNNSKNYNQNLIITNSFGQQIAILTAKNDKTIWDTRKIKPGIYFYSYTTEIVHKSGKIVIK